MIAGKCNNHGQSGKLSPHFRNTIDCLMKTQTFWESVAPNRIDQPFMQDED
jgi:hypothetical protein